MKTWFLKKLDKAFDAAITFLVILVLTAAGFVAVAPQTAKELIFRQNLTIQPEVKVDVGLGDEVTEILKRIEAKLP